MNLVDFFRDEANFFKPNGVPVKRSDFILRFINKVQFLVPPDELRAKFEIFCEQDVDTKKSFLEAAFPNNVYNYEPSYDFKVIALNIWRHRGLYLESNTGKSIFTKSEIADWISDLAPHINGENPYNNGGVNRQHSIFEFCVFQSLSKTFRKSVLLKVLPDKTYEVLKRVDFYN